jgi:hypothetical protein
MLPSRGCAWGNVGAASSGSTKSKLKKVELPGVLVTARPLTVVLLPPLESVTSNK